jgi:carbonic anhydrase
MCQAQPDQPAPSRRDFMKTSTAAAAAGLLTACGAAKPAGEAASQAAQAVTEELTPLTIGALTKEARDALTPDQIVEKLKEGNSRFREGRKITRDFLAEQRATASGQYPAAVFLSCIDSRAPSEVLFNLGLGDVFNCRLAGNVPNPDILGSMEFTTKLAGAKLVLVIGHSACGAVAGAIANAELGNLTQLLARIRPAIKATTFDGDKSADNAAYVDAVARKNVELAMDGIRKGSKVIADLEKEGSVRIAGAFYDIATGTVDFLA